MSTPDWYRGEGLDEAAVEVERWSADLPPAVAQAIASRLRERAGQLRGTAILESAAVDERFELLRTMRGREIGNRGEAMARAATVASDRAGPVRDDELAVVIGMMAGVLEEALTADFVKASTAGDPAGDDVDACRTIVRGLVDRGLAALRGSVNAQHDDAMRSVREALEGARR